MDRGVDCCVASTLVVGLVAGTVGMTIVDLKARQREASLLYSLEENILIVQTVLCTDRVLFINAGGGASICVEFAAVRSLAGGAGESAVFAVDRLALVKFDAAGRCREPLLKYTGADIQLTLHSKELTPDLARLLTRLADGAPLPDCLPLMTDALVRANYWEDPSIDTTVWALLRSGIKHELIRLGIINDGVIVLRAASLVRILHGSNELHKLIIHFNRILFVFKRIADDRLNEFELYYYTPNGGGATSLLIRIFDPAVYDQFVAALNSRLFTAQQSPKFLQHLTALWSKGKLSNFHYLSFLNTLGGRSAHDITSYPIYPWTLCRSFRYPQTLADAVASGDLEAAVLEGLDDIELRDLSKPIGALNINRLNDLLEEKDSLNYLYGSHYSNSYYVSYWLLRSHMELSLLLNEGKLDYRSFNDIRQSWNTVYDYDTYMELIPEHYSNDTSFLQGLADVVEPVALHCKAPEGFDDYKWFLFCHRIVLESPAVSSQLHQWIDLIFGYKQKGAQAKLNHNLFRDASYIVSDLADDANLLFSTTTKAKTPLVASPADCQAAAEFGRCPMQIFHKPHPSRAWQGNPFMACKEGGTLSVTDIKAMYDAFCEGKSRNSVADSLLSSATWMEILVRSPRELLPSKLACKIPSNRSVIDQMVLRYGDNQPRVWNGLISTNTSLTNVIETETDATRCEEISYNNFLCQYTRNGRYRVFDVFDLQHQNVFETTAIAHGSHEQLTSAAWIMGTIFFGTLSGSILTGGMGSLFYDHFTSEDSAEGFNLYQQGVHRGRITQLQVSKKRIASGCARETVCIWDPAVQKMPIIQAESWHEAAISALQFGDDSNVIYSADESGIFAAHDTRCPIWRNSVCPPVRFTGGWAVTQMYKVPNASNLQLVLRRRGDSLLKPTYIAQVAVPSMQCVSAPVCLGAGGELPQVVIGGSEQELSSPKVVEGGPAGPLVLEGSDVCLVARENDIVCLKEGRTTKAWAHGLAGGVSALASYPKLYDNHDEAAVSVPFIRAHARDLHKGLIIC